VGDKENPNAIICSCPAHATMHIDAATADMLQANNPHAEKFPMVIENIQIYDGR
jgi:hypothetical protein